MKNTKKISQEWLWSYSHWNTLLHVFKILATHLSQKLYHCYMVHPTTKLKSLFYLLRPDEFYHHKLKYIDSLLEFLEFGIDIHSILIPGKCWEFERELHGEQYFTERLAPDPILDEVLDGQFYS